MMSFDILIETALIGQGITDISDEEILETWHALFPQPLNNVGFVWLRNSQITAGNLEFLLQYRSHKDFQRIDGRKISMRNEIMLNGFCTAGGALASAHEFQAKMVVTAGMGGIYAARISNDLPEISRRQAILISAGFKDMIETRESLAYLCQNHISVMGMVEPYYDGFLFSREKSALDRQYKGEMLSQLTEENVFLLFNPIKNDLRLKNNSWLRDSIEIGKSAENAGGEFHPAVNKALADFSRGHSNKVQFGALLNNLLLALEILGKG
jgi:pseudouridine-5'-phosphate glycosidase